MELKLLENQLTTRWAGCKIFYKDKVDSTNVWARQMLPKGIERGSLFMTDFQTSGRGRMSRAWESPAGKNVLMSLVDQAPAEAQKTIELTLVAGIAITDALTTLYPALSFGLKWPNDIFLKNKKLGGILCEHDPSTRKVIIGIGINVNAQPSDFPEDIKKTSTSLCLHAGPDQNRLEIIKSCLKKYEQRREEYNQSGLEFLIPLWNQRSIHTGKKVRVATGQELFEGTAEGLDENGYLIVNVHGSSKTIVSGDVELIEG